MEEKELLKKTSRILHIISFFLFLILIKVWLLCFIQKEEKQKEATIPRNKTITIYANRGSIYDRYNNIIALNRIRYNACIYYAYIKQIPSIKWAKDQKGKKYKTYPRKEHIKKIAQLLSKKLNLESDRVEDLIHAKASLLPHVPFIIKENISEKEYFSLKMLERNYPGLHAEIKPERYYPFNEVASDAIGYMGAISQKQYFRIVNEIKDLEKSLEKENTQKLGYKNIEDAEKRYKYLKEKAYTVNDLIGKDGIENQYEESLRGFHGKKTYEIDVKGCFLKEKDTFPSKAGKKVTTSISLELQEFAEKLLAKDEKIREGKSTKYSREKKVMVEQKQPFIKGGAIVVMDPHTGEVLTLASYPRFNPNDFICSSNELLKKEKQKNIYKWLELPSYIALLFNGKMPIEREFYSEKKGFYKEKKKLSYREYLNFILEPTSCIHKALDKIKNIKKRYFYSRRYRSSFILR